jgi:deoxyribodipyrimidine photo-lyase
MPEKRRTLLWFRGKDVRLSDHPALASALEQGEIVPLFVVDPYFFAPARARELPHRIQFLLASLAELAQSIAALGSRLLFASGKSVDVVPELARRLRVTRVVAMRWVEPFARERDRRVVARLEVPFELFEGETLAKPGTLRTGSGEPFSVFTAFSKSFARNVSVDPPLPAPRALPPLPSEVASFESSELPSLNSLGIEHNPRVVAGGESAAHSRLQSFLDGAAAEYADARDRLDLSSTSRFSQDLKFGTLSVRSVWDAASRALERAPRALAKFRNELVWREFTHSTLWDRPELLSEPFRREFRDFPWSFDEARFEAWTSGRTGYPIVDAAARQLLSEGYVHNRARMVAASFLTKHLLTHYRYGEAHYLKYLTDGDWAQNNAGWQWAAGCGTDAQPYFRVFNPVLQGQKFDPSGDYVRRHVPELAGLPSELIHQPWQAPPLALRAAGVRLGRDYPEPIVEHTTARDRFLKIAESYLKAR